MSLYISMDTILDQVNHEELKTIIMENLEDLVDPDELYSLLSKSDQLDVEESETAKDEQDISKLFDEHLDSFMIVNSLKEAKELLEDSIMINEEFSNFVDSLASDGELGQQQINNYCYIGKYS